MSDADTAQLLDLRSRAQERLEALFPATVSLKDSSLVVWAEEIACAGGTVREVGAQLMRGGIMVEYDLAFRIRRDRLDRAPNIGERLTFEGEDFRIMRVVNPANDVAYLLGCDNLAK